MLEKSEVQSTNSNMFDLVMNDSLNFADIQDCVLESGMSSMTGQMGK